MILRSGKNVRWFKEAPGIGIPATVPEDLGRDFEQRVEDLFVAEMQKRAKRK